MTRIGYRMRELADFVSAVPGCSKSDALRAAGLPVHGMGSGREMNRAARKRPGFRILEPGTSPRSPPCYSTRPGANSARRQVSYQVATDNVPGT
jgi:hypothetical protein